MQPKTFSPPQTVHRPTSPTAKFALRSVLLALGVLGASCAVQTVVDYHPPPDVDTSNVRIFSDTLPPQAKLQVYILQDLQCSAKSVHERIGQLRYDDGIETARLSLDTRVRTDRPVRLNLFYLARRTARPSSCEFHMRYQFNRGYRYAVEFSLRNSECLVQLLEWPALANEQRASRIINRQDYQTDRCP